MKMRCKLIGLHSPDIGNVNLSVWLPEVEDCFGILVQMFVDADILGNEESFDFILCTPKWLAEEYQDREVVMLRHHIMVHRYDYDVLHKRLTKLINTIDVASWNDAADKIGRVAHWEFEDYRE